MSTPYRLALPPHYRACDFFEFHERDPQGVAEQVVGQTLRKGVVWKGHPSCLTLRFNDHEILAALDIDGTGTAPDDVIPLARRMLGLDQPVEAFEHAHATHPQIGRLIARNTGLRVPLAASPFEALTWAVTGQQISLNAAVSLRRRLILAAGVRHSSGLHCYPDAAAIAGLGPDTLRQSGFSQAKTQTLLTLSRQVLDGSLPLPRWLENKTAEEEIRTALLEIRGIGPWTVNYALLRGFGALDGALHGDAGVRRGLQHLLGQQEKVTEKQAQAWLAPFSPWRALVAAHLWALKADA